MNDPATRVPGRPWQAALPLSGPASFHTQDYLVTTANEAARRAIMAWPGWPERRLALTGPQGSGRTHLAQVWAGSTGALALTLAPTGHELPAFLHEAPAGACFWLDDAQKVAERTLFHLLNLSKEREIFLLLTAPEDFSPALPDLSSRWNALPKACLQSPDDDLLKAVLFKQFSDRQLKITPEVIEYIAKRLPRTLRHAVQLTEVMDHLSLEQSRAISIQTAREALERTGFS